MNLQTETKRRTQILQAIRQAALEEFAQNGQAGASTNAIAKRAGLSKQQLFYYIDGKDRLYEDTLLAIIGAWDAQFFDSVDADDPKAAISRYIDLKIRHALENPLECRLFSNEVARGAPVLRKHWDQSRAASQKACRLIEGWIAAGKIAEVDPMVFQMELWAVTQHYADYEAQVRFFLGLNSDEKIDAERLITQAQQLFLRGVGFEI